ncbi:hypothetical protein E2C01_006253 [Portunus trituberculatus]|uniref:Uncharacterized protein n=1 Tax=Portunus trituberculatus TaxID=210409 RepID=A0A5B7CYT4_PORTR|nr:hypothetical protein [Portunus trituberculatus]
MRRGGGEPESEVSESRVREGKRSHSASHYCTDVFHCSTLTPCFLLLASPAQCHSHTRDAAPAVQRQQNEEKNEAFRKEWKSSRS